MSDNGVCGAAPATPGLLTSQVIFASSVNGQIVPVKQKNTSLILDTVLYDLGDYRVDCGALYCIKIKYALSVQSNIQLTLRRKTVHKIK